MKLVIAGGNGTVGLHTARVARERGHEVVVLSRRTGQDLEGGDGVGDALVGADAVIDVSSVSTTSRARLRGFVRLMASVGSFIWGLSCGSRASVV